jgi:ribonuclease BN (tRNA processing enzyme)
MLGTGAPLADPDRSGPAVAIVVNGSSYIVDCGPGVVRRAAAAAKRDKVPALNAENLKTVFITHLHSDHTLGYPDLIFSPWVLGRTAPLQVYGPIGLQSMTDHILKAWEKDIDIRTNGLEPSNKTGYKVQVHEVKPGIVYKDDNVTVKAFLVNHGSWDQSLGYRFDTADRSIVLSGDTAYTDAIAKACKGCDILIHEVYSQAGFDKRQPEWQRYHSHFHTSSGQVAKVAGDAKPGLLVLYHQLFWGTTDDELVAEVHKGYAGKVVSAHDLDVY